MTAFERMTDQEIAEQLAAELKRSPAISLTLDAASAFRIGALLQLAWRHPNVGEDNRAFIIGLLDEISRIGPVVKAMLHQGWDESKDRR